MSEWSAAYCLFCEAHTETSVIAYLRVLGYTTISPVSVRFVVCQGKEVREKRPLLPGYLFVYVQNELDIGWVNGIDGVMYVLKYSDGSYTLKGDDLAFATWIYDNGGVIDISMAIQVGTKIRIVSGLLKEYGGRIVKVNKKRKSAAVEVGLGSTAKMVWVSFELIDQVTQNG